MKRSVIGISELIRSKAECEGGVADRRSKTGENITACFLLLSIAFLMPEGVFCFGLMMNNE